MDANIEAVIKVAQQATEPVRIGQSERMWFVPSANEGQGLLVDLAQYDEAPPRQSGFYLVSDVASFIKLLAEQRSGLPIKIYVHRVASAPVVVAVLNDNRGGNAAIQSPMPISDQAPAKIGWTEEGAGWRDHRVTLALMSTPQWQTWTGMDGKMQHQIAFGEFIEENIIDIVDPPGATMLEIATYLESKRDVSFRSGVRLNNGAVQFEHTENVEAKVGAGQIAVPEAFTIGIPVFVGVAPYSIVCRFRWRNDGGKLTLGYRLQRVTDTVKAVVDEIVNAIVLPDGAMILEGQPPGVSTCGVMISAAKAE